MNKSPEAFRTISEVAEALDVPPHVLRFWETRFTQVKPVKRGGGRRYYRPEDVRLLRGIRGLLYDDGMTIKGVQKILRERGVRHVIGLGTLPESDEPTDEASEAAAEIAAETSEPKAEPTPKAAPTPRAEPTPKAEPQPAASSAAAADQPTTHGPERPIPQADLFTPGADAGAAVAVAVAAKERPVAAKPADKRTLKALLGELQALREVMIEDPPR